MDRNFKIIEVFQHSKKDEHLSRRLYWDNDEHISQYVVQSLDDEENMYYPECFVNLCYGLDHKVVLHND